MASNYFDSLLENVEDQDMIYFDKWMNNGWFGLINDSSNNNNNIENETEGEKNATDKMVSCDGKFNLINNGKSIISIPYQLTIVNDDNNNNNETKSRFI